ncbi:nitrogenase component 1 [Spirulina sp. CS-785/01]|uniref:nitrogenase component 1 n=1 Tax=Spirulina sp. CS-785/01 TaxID=3021716 RepID=UPI00232C4BCF|nr:nitrogenase component 1 [Spirulina sp. CS-785/01]MDB9315514.1 nitrogenase component 1 [Spirulina sp. CS-785/01]
MTKTKSNQTNKTNYVSTTNACKLCKPLGACIAFRGIENCVPYLHGSQGCATYMRRYIISHFREPIDIASSSLSEKHAVYGGGPNLKKGILNVMEKYEAKMVGIATTCLTETIGDDVPQFLYEFNEEFGDQGLPTLVNVATPSYSGTHMEGFHATVKAVIDQLVGKTDMNTIAIAPKTIIPNVNIIPGLVSPEDLRHLRDILEDFGIAGTILPDYSDTLDAPATDEYAKIPEGGTPVADIAQMHQAKATLEFGRVLAATGNTGGELLRDRHSVPHYALGLPIGLRECDRFFATLETTTGQPTPRKYTQRRGRLVDAYVDGHKYIFGKKAVVYGEEDLCVAITAFLAEIGVKPVLCASGGKSGHFQEAITAVTQELLREPPLVKEGFDFYEIAEEIEQLQPDLLIGTSKGYPLARKLQIPLLRVGFPIHDRFGGQRTLHLGYQGTQRLYDQLVNAVLEKKQADSPVGYGYL